MRNPPQGRCPACGMANLLSYAEAAVLCCGFCGTWCEQDRTTRVVYDSGYIAERYERYTTTEAMSDLRRRVLEGVIHLHETLPLGQVCVRRGRLLDVGVGNGSFIRRARGCGWDAWGHDVNPTEYEGVRRTSLPIDRILAPEERYRVITFFDCLEHFQELEWAPRLARNTDWIMLSAPRVPDGFPTVEWKHRRIGEHHFHFRNPETFEVLFGSSDVRVTCVYFDNPEDVIRGNLPDGQPNVMTVALRCLPADAPVIPHAEKVLIG